MQKNFTLQKYCRAKIKSKLLVLLFFVTQSADNQWCVNKNRCYFNKSVFRFAFFNRLSLNLPVSQKALTFNVLGWLEL